MQGGGLSQLFRRKTGAKLPLWPLCWPALMYKSIPAIARSPLEQSGPPERMSPGEHVPKGTRS